VAATPPQSTPPPVRRRRSPLVAALLLAAFSAAAINLGFLLQHRGLGGQKVNGATAMLSMLRNRTWVAGQVVGWVGFAAQLAALALAPLSLVQAFAAGGLAISLPVAARGCGYRVTRRQLLAISLIAVGLASLPIGLRAHSHLDGGALLPSLLLVLLIAAAIGVAGGAPARAVAAGICYGAADAAIKAASFGWRAHPAGALVSSWTLLALIATFGGFVAFQAALRGGGAVSSISLMNLLATLVALGFGVFAFAESLGRTSTATVLHLVAIAVVLGCVPVLAAGQERIAALGPQVERGGVSRAWIRRALIYGVRGSAVIATIVICALVGTGLLYGLRRLGWLATGPRIQDSLPLLALARFDDQPLVAVAGAFLAAGAIFGATLVGASAPRRVALAGALSLVVLLLGSDASFALTNNLQLGYVVGHRFPPLGPWLEAALFAVGAAIPGAMADLGHGRPRLPARKAEVRGKQEPRIRSTPT
jgi:hypothetical protein